jgi:AcrR family transcriptional regulator
MSADLSPQTTEVVSGLAARRADRRNAGARRSDERWSAILAGAAQVFRRLGYGNATLEDIAAEVGFNRASIYYYVSTKADLLVEILHQPIFDMTNGLLLIRHSDIAPSQKLREAINGHMKALANSYPELFVFLSEHLHLLTIGDPEGDVVENARRYGDLFTEIIEEGQAAGVVRSDVNARIAMLGIVGMCNWTHRWYRESGGMTLTEIGHDFATLVLDCLVIPGR